jgi:hypothetical protein
VIKLVRKVAAVAAAAVAIKEVSERFMESRQPKKSAVRRFAPSGGLLLAAGGGIAYLAATGRLNGLLNRKSEGSSPRSEAGL